MQPIGGYHLNLPSDRHFSDQCIKVNSGRSVGVVRVGTKATEWVLISSVLNLVLASCLNQCIAANANSGSLPCFIACPLSGEL